MWLSEKTTAGHGPSGTEANIGPVTLGGSNASVMLSGENRGLGLLMPGGIQWQPETGTQVMVLQTGDGERFILGTAAAPTVPLADGELCLSCGSVCLKIGRDGVFITGRLFLNGCEIGNREEK